MNRFELLDFVLKNRSAILGCLLVLLLMDGGKPSSAQKVSSTHIYTNPILFADYSDPDVIRTGKDFYMIASSFHFVPGIPILHSLDLVHWEIAGHVLSRLNFDPRYDMNGGNRYGGGVWAPSVRFHDGRYYVYFPTPDEGIFVSTAPKMTGPWSSPEAVIPGSGFEDPCPFWDDDGKAYLIHSRLGAGPLVLHRMSTDGKSVLDSGKIIVQDPIHLPTLEGPKLYKHDGWYYILAPMGGVGEGSQAVLRARNIYGPYDYRIVLAQGSTTVRGPHQGAYVETSDGKGWFLHFASRGAHGRILYLEPVRWKDDWPVIGEAAPEVTTGQPVAKEKLPVVVAGAAAMKPQVSDDFDEKTLPPMWEWNHNPNDALWSLSERIGYLRLHPDFASDLRHARNTLTEMMQDKSFEVTTRMDLRHLSNGDQVGLSLFDQSLSYIGVAQTNGHYELVASYQGCKLPGPPVRGKKVQLRAVVHIDKVRYSYSLDDGRTFHALGQPNTLTFSWWKASRPALFAFSTVRHGYKESFVDVDWLHYRSEMGTFAW
jgi:beta-xylosidase